MLVLQLIFHWLNSYCVREGGAYLNTCMLLLRVGGANMSNSCELLVRVSGASMGNSGVLLVRLGDA